MNKKGEGEVKTSSSDGGGNENVCVCRLFYQIESLSRFSLFTCSYYTDQINSNYIRILDFLVMMRCCLFARVLLRSDFSAKFHHHHRHQFQCGNRFHLFVLFAVFLSLSLYDLVLCFFFLASIHKFFYGEREKKENNYDSVRKYNRWSN